MSSSLKSCCTFISQRCVFTILGSIGLCIQAMFSVIMSMTIIEMVVRTESFEEQDNKSCASADNVTVNNKTFFISQIEHDNAVERYPWDEYTQGIILSSFSWSSTIAQFFHGTLAERFGGKHLLGFAILAQAVLTSITPFVINWCGSTGLIINRVIMGLATDGLYPVVTAMIPHWAAPAEKTKVGNAIYSGSVLGLCFGNITSALIIKYSGMGWPAVFYFVGIVGMIWYPLWLVLVYENPEVHPFISDEELEYLRSNSSENQVKRCKLPPTPWKHILLCKEFWAFTISYMGCNCAFYLMFSGLPRYMGNVIKFPIESNGYFSSLPYIFMWLNSMISAWISDKILEKKWMSLTNVRKLLTTISVPVPGIFLLFASYAECDKTMVVIMFMIGITLIGSFHTSTLMNPLDLSPNYAGSIMSTGCGISLTVAILAPYLVGVLVPNSTINEWRSVFWLIFLFACCSNAVYLLCFKAEVQDWDDPNFVRSTTKRRKIKKEVELEVVFE